MDYKKSIFIPFTPFSMKGNLVINAQKFCNFWSEKEIYKKRLAKNKDCKHFVLHDGPPYANGPIHIGHALNKILKDFVVRWKNMDNFYADFIPGWDTHGLPIENQIEKNKKHNFKSLSLIEKRLLCKKFALSQVDFQNSQLKKLHMFSSFEKRYLTLDHQFVINELNIFAELVEKKLIFWDLKPVSWSYSSQTALAESEIIYLPKEEDSIYFYFEIVDKSKDLNGARAIVWTTTPYTLEANLALAFNPKNNYIVFSYEDNKYVCAEERFDLLIKLFEWKKEGIHIFNIYIGNYFENQEYKNVVTQEIRKVVVGKFITNEAGSGIVHIATGFGLDDYKLGLKCNIPVYCSIDANGFFYKESKFKRVSGLFYEEGSKVVIDFLKENNHLIKVESIIHNIGHDWRTKKPTLYRSTQQWFLNIEKIKDEFKDINKAFTFYPSWLGKKLEDIICKRDEWCLSRQRSWGVPIPIIFSEEEPLLDLEQIKHTVDLINKYGIEIWYEKSADFFILEKYKNKKNLSKSSDIFDVWFDSGTSFLSFNKEAKNIDSDLYLEGFDQLRGWFNSSSIISILHKKKLPFKTLIAHGFVLDEKGNKMSKSLGNVLNPNDFVDKYGAEILRLWVANTNYFEDIKYNNSSVDNVISQYRKIRNTLFRYSLSLIDKYAFNPSLLNSLTFSDTQYIYSVFCIEMEKALKEFETFHFFKAIQIVMNFINLYSGWFLEISKDCLYCDLMESPKKQEITTIVYEVFNKCLIFFSVFLPQTCEEAYGFFNKEKKEESIFLESWISVKKTNYEVDFAKWNKFFELKTLIYSQIEIAKNEKIVNFISEVKLIIDSKIVDDFEIKELTRLLNIAEIVVIENNEGKIKIEKSALPTCLRCKRCVEKVNENILCERCQKIIKEQQK